MSSIIYTTYQHNVQHAGKYDFVLVPTSAAVRINALIRDPSTPMLQTLECICFQPLQLTGLIRFTPNYWAGLEIPRYEIPL